MKRLGQHFLINKDAVEKIINALDLKEDDVVIEVGPGHGELTNELLKRPIKKLIAVEKDSKLSKELKLKNQKLKVKILEGDILKVLPQLKEEKLKIVGNIPYYLTGYLLRVIGELENKPELIIFTIQKEVAERIAAKPPKMNLLAASVQFWAEPKIIADLPPSYFKPKPKVWSSIIKLKAASYKLEAEKRDYYNFIKALFRQPRKTILNNLAAAFKRPKDEIEKELIKVNVKANDRPQNLSLEQIIKLINNFKF